MSPRHLSPTASPEQLRFPFAETSRQETPCGAAMVPTLAASVPPRTVWRGLSEPQRDQVRRAVLALTTDLLRKEAADAPHQ